MALQLSALLLLRPGGNPSRSLAWVRSGLRYSATAKLEIIRLVRIPDAIRERIVQLALDETELSPWELATRFTDTANYFVSEASVYRLLKALDLIASPAYIVMKAADEFKDKTTAPNQLWQTDFTYLLKVTGWGLVLSQYGPGRLLWRYIIAWKLCTRQ